MDSNLAVRDVRLDEFDALGRLLVKVYSGLPGFPTPAEQPGYYEMLANIGRFNEKPNTRVVVALSGKEELVGGVVCFGDMACYGSGGTATSEQKASGIRLLGVHPKFRSMGGGRALTNACINRTRARPFSSHSPHDEGNAGCLGTL